LIKVISVLKDMSGESLPHRTRLKAQKDTPRRI